jgi:hypothetical protein
MYHLSLTWRITILKAPPFPPTPVYPMAFMLDAAEPCGIGSAMDGAALVRKNAKAITMIFVFIPDSPFLVRCFIAAAQF